MSFSSYDSMLSAASTKLQIRLRRHTTRKACGPCPQCGGNDRFVVWLFEEYGWCSRCNYSVWLTENVSEARARATEEKANRERRVIELRAAMSLSVEWQDYNLAAIRQPELWVAEGMTTDDISKWGLGYTDSCPSFPGSRSLTIPVFIKQSLVDIRHKLLDAGPEMGKYRSHLPDLTPAPFNLDAIYSFETVIVVEGEKKSIALSRYGFPNNVGIPGINTAEMLITELSRPDTKKPKRVVVAFDPGSNNQAERLALAIPDDITGLVADCFEKPDDMLFRYGSSTLETILKQSRPPLTHQSKMGRRKYATAH